MQSSEAYQTAMHTLDQYRGTVVACTYCLPPSLARPESLETLQSRFYDAVARVVLGQPHLQVGIADADSRNPVFVRLDRLDLRNHVDWKSLGDSSHLEPAYLKSMQAQLDSRYGHLDTQPGWRLIILHKVGAESMEVLYVWNHPHHDGISAKIFHQDLLRNLNQTFDQNKKPTLNVTQGSDSRMLNLPDCSDKLPPNPEILSSWPMTPSFLLKCLWTELKPPSIFPPGNTHATWAPIKASPFATQFRTFTVEGDTVKKLVGACRPHQTTLTGLVQALVLVYLTSALEDVEGFASMTPYDLRHILPSHTPQYPWLQPKESMCNYVSIVDHEHDAELVTAIRSRIPAQAMDAGLSADIMEVVWSVSARVRREIKARLDSGVWNDMIGIMKFVSDWRTQQQSKARKVRHLSWVVTNLGVIDGEISNTRGQEEEGWSLRRAELVLGADIAAAVFNVSMMTVKDERMCVTCSWQDCVVDPALGERLVGSLERWLNGIVA